MQSDEFNASRLATTITVALTSNTDRAGVPGNVFLGAETTGLTKASVAVVTSVVTIDRTGLDPPVGHVDADVVDRVAAGLRLVLDL